MRTALRSGWLWCLAVPLTAVSLIAQEQVSPPAPPHTIPEGTIFLVRLDDRLDSRRVEQGKHFKAKLVEDLVAPDGTTLARGKRVKGHVSSVEQGLHARMLLSFDEIETDHGWMPLIATLTGVPGEHAAKQPDAEGEIERQGRSKQRTIETAAVGAALGAAGGAAAGGGKGAAIGAGVGATAGALAGILTDRNLRLDKGTVLEVRLDHPLHVPLY